TGTNFVGVTTISFGGILAASFTLNSSTQLTALSPAHVAGLVDIQVTTTSGISAAASADRFEYFAAPTVTSLVPTSGPTAGGTVIAISGSNFIGVTSVSFGATPATSFTVNSATQITATAPAHSAGTVDITVTTAGGTSALGAADQYTFAAAPAVSRLSTTAGPTAGLNQIKVIGTNFINVTQVSFGGVAATIVEVLPTDRKS